MGIESLNFDGCLTHIISFSLLSIFLPSVTTASLHIITFSLRFNLATIPIRILTGLSRRYSSHRACYPVSIMESRFLEGDHDTTSESINGSSGNGSGNSTPLEDVPATNRSTQILDIRSIQPPDVNLETDLAEWSESTTQPPEFEHILSAARALRESSIPVAFPTETVYGLGADATRSSAVRGIYAAKQRPSDNPLIVHIGSLPQLRRLLHQSIPQLNRVNHIQSSLRDTSQHPTSDPIPPIYLPLISRFWPGPLTILLPLPHPSPLAPEVTGGPTSNLTTFGCRMPSSPLCRLLISLTDRPLAAPSANASTRPSPTTAQHVYHDLKGRIDLILDGGPCDVGVESTVVDGLSDPPAILRPGGVGIEEIRKLGGNGRM